MKTPILTMVAIALGILLTIAIGCQRPDDPDFSNPLDPTDPDYVPPVATITEGPAEGETVPDADVSFTWRGADRVDTYRSRLNESEWTDWQATTAVDFQMLDEGPHVFYVMGRYPTGAEQTEPTARTFIVNAVTGPALMFRPRRVVVEPGDTFSVDVIAEEVTDLMGARVRITSDPQALRLQNVAKGSFLAENGGTVVFLDSGDDGTLTGVLAVDTAVAEGEPDGVNGSGTVATLSFMARAVGTTALSYTDNSALRDSQNQEIPLRDGIECEVVVQEGAR
jgi:hypothetical protein